MTQQWSRYQQGVFDVLAERRGNVAVNAVAGSGKTTTIVEAAKRLKGSAYLAAFNKKMGEELQARVAGIPGKQAGTFHSIGYKALAGRFGPLTVKAKKISDEWYERAQDHAKLAELGPSVAKLASLAKQAAFGVAHPPSTEDWRGLIEHFGVLEDAPEGTTEAELVRHVSTMLRWSEQVAERGVVDFDDMIYLPLKLGLRVMKFNTVFVDEAQDTNTARRLLTRAMCWPESVVVAVGDPRQAIYGFCHPEGTPVLTPKGLREIETLEEGDAVIVSNANGETEGWSGKKRVLKVHRYWHDYRMVTLHLGPSKQVHLTENHRVPVRLDPQAQYYTYLMSRRGVYRVGYCQAFTVGQFMLQLRKKTEKADAVWVLDSFKTKAAAREAEAYLLQTVKGRTFWNLTDDEVDALPRQEAAAFRLLHQFGRRPEFPFLGGTGRKKRIARNGAFIVEACNVLNGMLGTSFPNVKRNRKRRGQNRQRFEWAPLKVRYSYYQGYVYGLTVEPSESGLPLYFAGEGNVLVHNSGAGSSAMADMIEAFEMQELPLSICYRCSKAVVKEAQQYLPSIEAFEGAPEGAVTEAALRGLLAQRPAPTDALLCRFNRPLVRVAFELIRAGVPTRIEGREIGESLLALTKKWSGVRLLGELSEKLIAWQDKEVGRLRARKAYGRIAGVTDKVGAMAALIDRTRELRGEVPELQALIKEMFQDSDGRTRRVFTLSSVHKAKGLEWDRVFVLGRGEVMPSPYATKPWELEQEQNLVYVAATRARRELVWLRGVEEEVEREGQGVGAVKDEKISLDIT